MKNVVILFYSIANPEPIIERAFKLLKPEAGTLHLFFYFEEHVPKTLTSIMAYIGFLGEKVKSDMENSIIENYQLQVQGIISDAKLHAAYKKIATKHYNITDFHNLQELLKSFSLDYLIINHTENEYIYQATKNNELKQLLHAYEGKYELYSDGFKK